MDGFIVIITGIIVTWVIFCILPAKECYHCGKRTELYYKGFRGICTTCLYEDKRL